MTIEQNPFQQGGFNIGQAILITALARRTSSVSKEKETIFKWESDPPYEEPITGFFVGYTYKQNGIYHPGFQIGNSYSIEPEYVPPFLRVTETVKLARIKRHARFNDEFAFFNCISKFFA